MNVVELFSGIGAQAKALERRELDFNIIATCDWDINAIIAYDLIHNGKQINNTYLDMNNEKLTQKLLMLNLSANGKKPMTEKAIKRLPSITKANLLYAIDRTHNKIDITKVKGVDFDQRIDLMTYSFPCQDLSLAGNWHNNQGGIDRNSGNRSSLLWEVERILDERAEERLDLPRFLLMENVTAILSPKHRDNFKEWQDSLNRLGYYNKIYTLDAREFGVPQMRERTYMLSVFIDGLSSAVVDNLMNDINRVTEENLSKQYPRMKFTMKDVLKTDYRNKWYLEEAVYSNPNITESRKNIGRKNIRINSETKYVPTITTKQDRHPNSGLVDFSRRGAGKMDYRYLTPRECFILMGFDEKDFQSLMNNNFSTAKNRHFFTRDKLNRMAGNSICVNVLESIFEMVNEINTKYF